MRSRLEFLRQRHFWIILLLFVLCVLLHYPQTFLSFLGLAGDSPLGLERHALERILFLAPAIYSAHVFGLSGGCLTLALALAAMLPRVLFVSDHPRDAAFETALTIIVGALINIGLESRRREIGRREETILKLEAVRRELQRISRQFREIFEKAHDAIWIQDPDGKIISANAGCSVVTGYGREAMIGMEISRLFPNEALERARQVMKTLLEHGDIEQPYEQQIIKKDGSRAQIMITSSLLGEDQSATFLHIARDITAERKLQHSLRLYSEQIGRAHEEERKRIARELHDDTIQTLVALSRQLDSVISGQRKGRTKSGSLLENMRQEIDESLIRIRRFIQYLRPPILEYLGLVPALRELVEQMQREAGIRMSMESTREKYPLTPEQQLLVYRIAQEALRNVWKHSRAARCTVRLSLDGEQNCLRVLIQDDGIGLPSRDVNDLISSGKLGLMGMQERAHLLGGTLEIQSAGGKGTSVVLTLPDGMGGASDAGGPDQLETG